MGKKKRRGLKIFLRIQIVLVLLLIAAITYYYVGGYAEELSKLHDSALRKVRDAKESTFRSVETGIAYDALGDVLTLLKGEKDVYYLEYPDIPIYAKEAIISIEDKKFYDHGGVDYKAIVRAAYYMVKKGKVTQGASTITQQLARNIFLTQDRTWERKIEEIYIAIELEKRFSKNQILEYYLNNIYFSNGFYGIEAAARGYFSLPSQQLSLSQIAFLCAIPNSPTKYDPEQDASSALSRRNLILRNMFEDGIISLDEYNDALKEKIMLNQQKSERHNYQETYTLYCATRALMEIEGFEFQTEFNSPEEEALYDEEYQDLYAKCNRDLYRNGYRIYTSLDSAMQEDLQEILDKELEENQEKNSEGIYALQGAAVCIDNETGMVKAIVGGREQQYDGYTLNRAYQSFRQPGSSIKPLIVYTPALEMGYTPDSTVSDIELEDGPTNSGNNYSGEMTLRRALELSKNTVAWQLIDIITPAKALEYLKAMNFSGIEKTDEIPAIALGGFTKGVSPIEMAEGFATLENDGFFRKATCIIKITDIEGNTIYQPDVVGEAVYKEDAARQMTDMMRGVFTAPGATGVGIGLENMDCAGKTGTTNDNKDGWFVGYTTYYTTAVWVGYDTPKELKGLWGSTMPGSIWHDFMTKIHKYLPNKMLNISVIRDGLTPEESEVTLEGFIVDESVNQNGETYLADPENGQETDNREPQASENPQLQESIDILEPQTGSENNEQIPQEANP